MNLYMISLGCVKNQVDSEMILGLCQKANIKHTDDIQKADIFIVNTCGFIESAKKEAIDTILELVEYKTDNKILIVCGCLAQRYKEELEKLIPEIDRIISIDEYKDIANILTNMLGEQHNFNSNMSHFNRVYQTKPHYRYVKISEGCTNRCTYCAIPLIRGDLKSRKKEDIITEVKNHVADNVKEINLISQDTTKYGFDLYNKLTIVELLESLCEIPGDFKIRLLYLYPNIVTDELIDFIKNNDKVMPYFDIPIQHTEDKILKLMNRRGSKEDIGNLIDKIRNEIPHSIIRTTLIVGFPYEEETDVDNMIEFIQKHPFDRLGVFTYSPEEDTKSFDMPQTIAEEEKIRRLNQVMEAQQYISLRLNQNKIDNIYDCIIEDYDEENFMYVGRSYKFAPDDIDGSIYVAANGPHNIGDVISVKIVDADMYSLTAVEVEKNED